MDEILKAPVEDRVVGFRQVMKAINSNQLRCVMIATDIDGNMAGKVISICNERRVPFTLGKTKSEMGEMLGIDVACAMCGIKASEQKQ